MGCVFGCFRVKDRDRNHAYLGSDVVSSKIKGKFPKSCGTPPETPTEIHGTSKRVVSPYDGDDEASKSHSWLPTMSRRKLHLGEQYTLLPTFAANLFEEVGKSPFPENSGSANHVSNCCRSDKMKHTRRNLNQLLKGNTVEGVGSPVGTEVPSDNVDNLVQDTSGNHIATGQYPTKYVRFECAEHSPSEIDRQSCKQFDSPDLQVRQAQVPKFNNSPYPTPLKLADQMQTPGTVYPTNLENLAIRKNARIRSQYVYPVLNAVKNLAQSKALKQGSKPHQLGSGEHTDNKENVSPERPESGKKWQLVGDSMKHNDLQNPVSVESSLSHWLKPALSNDVGCRNDWSVSNRSAHSGRTCDSDMPILGTVATYRNDELSQISHQWMYGNGNLISAKDLKSQNTRILPNERSHSVKNSDSERPILGIVAAHWKDEQSQVSLKWWDGNGIPNSTTKYKEDQKVSWHATPFEERLEKALSDEKLLPQRKPVFDESEDSDTAASRFSASNHITSILVSGV